MGQSSEGLHTFPKVTHLVRQSQDLNSALLGSRIIVCPLASAVSLEIMSHLQYLKAHLSCLFLSSPQCSHCHHPGTFSPSPSLTLPSSSLCFSISSPQSYFLLYLGLNPPMVPLGDRSALLGSISLSLLPGVSHGCLFPLLNLVSIWWCLFKCKYCTPGKGALRHQH